MRDEFLETWELTLDGHERSGFCATVWPVRTSAGTPAVLKIGVVDEETEHEALALQYWHGRGACKLLRAEPRRGVLLLERLYDEDLTTLWDIEACEIVGGLYQQLHVPAPPQLRRLSDIAGRWASGLSELKGAPVPPRLLQQAIGIARDFATDPATDGTMIHTDLHYENVLAADRSDWLAIDPKPLSGDPHFELAPMLWNRYDELAGDVRRGLRARFHALIDAAELDEKRSRDWVILRMMVNVMWRAQDPDATHGAHQATRDVAIAKAVQD